MDTVEILGAADGKIAERTVDKCDWSNDLILSSVK